MSKRTRFHSNNHFLRRRRLFAYALGFCFALTASIASTVNANEPLSIWANDEAGAVYASDRLLKIDIRLDPEDWTALRLSHRTAEMDRIAEDPYVYYKADVDIDGVIFKTVGVRKKGFFGSVVSTRPSLKIRFDEWDEDQHFHGLDQLTLNNNVQDPTQMHQYLAYWVFDRAGAVAPRCNFALVTVNGEDLGIYSNVESIRDPFLKRAFKDSDGKLYEGYAGDLVSNSSDFNRIVRKNGKPKSGRKSLERLRDAMNATENRLEKIEQVLHVDAFITFWTTEVLIGHWDSYSGNRNNYYLYRDRHSDKFYFIPWGADSIFQDPGPFITRPVPRSLKAVGMLCNRLWEIPDVRDRYEKEMRRLLKEVWVEDEIVSEIQRVQKMLEPHMKVNPKILSAYLTGARAFIKNRRPQFVSELDRETVEWPKVGPYLPGAGQPRSRMEIIGSFNTTISEKDPEDPFTGADASLTIRIDGTERPEFFSRVGVFAKPDLPEFIRPGYPYLHLIGIDKKQQTWHLQFYIDPISAAEQGPELPVDHFSIWAMMVKGDIQSPEAERRIFGVVGSFELQQFEHKIGGTIEGKFRIETQAFRD